MVAIHIYIIIEVILVALVQHTVGNSNINKGSLIGNYAPASLPIDLGLHGPSSNSTNVLISDHSLQYQHQMGTNSLLGSYATPFSLSDSHVSIGSMPNTSKTTSRSNAPTNDRDESPMVGVCVQQSPVVIH